MIYFSRVFLCLFVLSFFAGCGDQSGVVATDAEVNAYVQEHGDLSLSPDDPSHALEIAE